MKNSRPLAGGKSRQVIENKLYHFLLEVAYEYKS